MTQPHRQTRSNAAEAPLGQTIARILRDQITAHRGLLAALDAHRDALSAADRAALAEATRMESALISKIAELELERRVLLGVPEQRALAGEVGPTLPLIARTLPAAARAEVTALAEELKGLAETAAKKRAAVEAANSSLLNHMQGLIRQIASRLSHAGTYGATGRVAAGPAVVSGLDIRS